MNVNTARRTTKFPIARFMKINIPCKIGAAALGSVAAIAGFSRLSLAQDSAGIVPGAQNAIVYKQSGDFSGWPSMAQTPDGTLYVGCGAMGHSATFVSHDGGRNWLWTKDPFPGNPADRTPDGGAVSVVPDGWHTIPADRFDEYKRSGYLTHRGGKDRGSYLGSAKIVTRTPDGKVTRRPLPGAEDATFLNLDNTFLTRSGVRLMPLYGYLRRPCTGGNNSYVVRSADGGKTWQIVTIAAQINDNAGHSTGFNETALAQLSGGKIVAMMRSADDQHNNPEADGSLFESTSTDDGMTWSAPVKTPIWGYPANLLVLKNGDLLCTYGYRRRPFGIRACLSHDGGATWDMAHEFVLRDDSYNGTLGYPKTKMNADDSLVTVYYFTTPDRNTHIEATVWRVPPTSGGTAAVTDGAKP